MRVNPNAVIALCALVLGLVGGAYGGYEWEHSDVSALKLADAQHEAKAVQDARDEEKRRASKQEGIANDAKKERDIARADAAGAASAAVGLRKQLATYEQQARLAQHSGATGDSAATGDPIGVLADLLRRADDRAGVLAEYADRARIAGSECERDYDALAGTK
ncbi:DUF2514 family protein [Paraburkholderia sp. J8-2]|uniref:DUF2514 family protein n=1 Tax=Paraburkholderia sp. J8-2 TaxID=2805440 RepID=UPI002AB73BCF|nr:DUF2514 family protein [Paraburkholderia sp. J8-2]